MDGEHEDGTDMTYCKICNVQVQVDPDTHREMVGERPHRVHQTQAFCTVCQRHYPDYEKGYIHMIQNYGHPLVPFNLDKPETLAGAIVAGVPIRLTR